MYSSTTNQHTAERCDMTWEIESFCMGWWVWINTIFCDFKRVFISQAKPEVDGNNSLWLF